MAAESARRKANTAGVAFGLPTLSNAVQRLRQSLDPEVLSGSNNLTVFGPVKRWSQNIKRSIWHHSLYRLCRGGHSWDEGTLMA